MDELTLTQDEIEKIHIAREAANLAAIQLKQDIKDVMKTASGRRFIDWLLRISGPYSNHFDRDPLITANNLGKSYVGIQIHTLLMAQCPDLYQQMINEFRSRALSRKGKK
jgi:hypothetical protein